MLWERFEDGRTFTSEGPWGGVTIRDECHPRGARLTAEMGSRFAIVTVTLFLYGRPELVRHFDELDEAEAWCERAKAGIGLVLDREPLIGDPGVRGQAVAAARALNDVLATLGDQR
jgi:hypothetical protein